MVYLTIAFFFALAAGTVGKIKGSSFLLWFLIGFLFPAIGLVVAVLYRFETEEPRRQCPRCGKVVMAYDAVCTRCGAELEYPQSDELVPPAARARLS